MLAEDEGGEPGTDEGGVQCTCRHGHIWATCVGWTCLLRVAAPVVQVGPPNPTARPGPVHRMGRAVCRQALTLTGLPELACSHSAKAAIKHIADVDRYASWWCGGRRPNMWLPAATAAASIAATAATPLSLPLAASAAPAAPVAPAVASRGIRRRRRLWRRGAVRVEPRATP